MKNIVAVLFVISMVEAITLSKVDFSKNTALDQAIIAMANSEEEGYQYNVMCYSSSNTLLNINIYSPASSVPKKVQLSTKAVVRPMLGLAKDKLFLLHNSNLEVFNLNETTPSSVLSVTLPNIDSNSSMAVIHREFVSGKPETYLVACSASFISLFSDNGTLVKSTNFPCGNYLSYGYNYLAVRSTAQVEMYTVTTGGVLTYYTTFSINDNNTQTYDRDPSIINKFDVVYSVVSDKSSIQVNSPSDYSKFTTIPNVQLYAKNEIDYMDTLFVPMISTFGSFVVVGGFGYSANVPRSGRVQIFYDKYLMTVTSSRFDLVYTMNGVSEYQYCGYAVSMSANKLFVGGKAKLNTDGTLTGSNVDISNYTSKYCNSATSCMCPSGYYYNQYLSTCLVQVSQNASVLIGFILFAFLIVAIIVFCILYKKWNDNKSKKHEINGESYDFVKLEEVPIDVSTETLTFGCNDGETLPLNVSRQQEITISNNSMANKKINIIIPQTYRFDLQASPQTCTVMSNSNVTITFTIVMKCKCNITADDTTDIVGIMIGEENDEESKTYIKLDFCIKTEDYIIVDYKDIRINKTVGTGQASEVDMITYESQQYAMKKFKEEYNDELNNTLTNKVIELSKINNKYLVQILKATNAIGNYSIIYDYCVLGNIKNIYQLNGIEKKLLWKCLYNAALGLEVLHNKGIIHRNIKPENILIVSRDSSNDVCAKLVDYDLPIGLVSKVHANQMKENVGDEVYLSPEILNNEEVTNTCDIYALAIVINEVFGKSKPYSNKGSSWNVIESVNKGERPEISDEVPPKIAEIIPNMWNQIPERRCNIHAVVKAFKDAENNLDKPKPVPNLLDIEDVPKPKSAPKTQSRPTLSKKPTKVSVAESKAADALIDDLLGDAPAPKPVEQVKQEEKAADALVDDLLGDTPSQPAPTGPTQPVEQIKQEEKAADDLVDSLLDDL